MSEEKIWAEIKNKPDDELYALVGNQDTHSKIKLMAETELRRREMAQQQEITSKNLSATNKLVYATWGLVFVTLILTLVTFFAPSK